MLHWLESRPRAAIALTLSLAAASRAQAIARQPTELSGDSRIYDLLARSLLGGLGFALEGGAPTAVFTPGYPIFLASVYGAIQPDPIVARCAHLLLGLGFVLLVVRFGALCLDPRSAIVAGLVAAVYPPFFWLPGRLLSENLALPITVAAAIATVMTVKKGSHRWATLAGVLLGAGILARGAGIFLAAVLAVGMAVFGAKGLRRLNAAALVATTLVSCLLTVSPWLLRNASVLGSPVLTTHSGITLYSSYWPPVNGGRRIWGKIATVDDVNVRRAYEKETEVMRSRALEAVVRERLRHEPGHALALIPEKIAALLLPFDWEIIPPRVGHSKSTNLAYLVLLVPAAVGAWRLLRHPPALAWVIWSLPLAALAQAVVFYGSPRFRLMAEPSLVLLASYGITQWIAPVDDSGRARP